MKGKSRGQTYLGRRVECASARQLWNMALRAGTATTQAPRAARLRSAQAIDLSASSETLLLTCGAHRPEAGVLKKKGRG